ncbi:MAG: PQQ-binding-like beta-propeller repeat protein [Bacteroidia bacterium]
MPPQFKLLFIACILVTACQPENDAYKSWQVYKGDKESTSYSSIDQINRSNVAQLEVAWTYLHDDVPEGMRFGKYECNPIVVDDVLYATSSRSWVYALDACSGQKIWSFDPFDGERGGGMKRGVTYWSDGEDKRILFTADHFLFAVEAQTGKPIPSFGTNGKVNLNENLGVNPDSVWVIPTSPGIIFRDLIMSSVRRSPSPTTRPRPYSRHNVRTGEMAWIFHTIPQPGEPGYETWPPTHGNTPAAAQLGRYEPR